MWTLKIFDSSNLDNWNKYFKSIEKKSVYNTPEYIKILEKNYKDKAELLIFGNEEEFVYYPYFKRSLSKLTYLKYTKFNKYYDIISSWYYGGPLVNNYSNELFERFRIEFIKYCRANKIVTEFIRFDPFIENWNFEYKNMKKIEERLIVYIDLNKTIEDILNNYKKKVNKNLRKAKNSGISIEISKDNDCLKKFVDIYHYEMKRKNAPKGYFFDYRFFKEFMSLDGVFFVIIKKEDKFLGGGFVFGDNKYIIHDYLRATDSGYWDLRINDYFIHCNINNFKRSGYWIYDLQGGREGVFEFKRSFSNLTKQFMIGHSVFLEDIYKKITVLNPSIDKNFFPLYRQSDKNV